MKTQLKAHAQLLTVFNSVDFNPFTIAPWGPRVYSIGQWLLLGLLVSLPFMTSAQLNDSTTVRAVFGSGNTELQELMSAIGVEKHHIELNDPHLSGKFFQLTYQEYRNGVAQPEVNLTSRKDLFQLDSSGKMAFDVYARAVDATTLEAFFRFTRVGQRKQFKAEASQAGQYSFRTDILAYQHQQAKIPVGKKFTFLVYTLPHEKDGYFQYCALAQSEVPVKEWYKQFGVKHFVAYQLLIE